MCTFKAINLRDLSGFKEAMERVPSRKNVGDIKTHA
jgi:hypothetical protein